MSNNPGLVDFAIRLVNSVFNLPHGQVKVFGGNSNYRSTVINAANFEGGNSLNLAVTASSVTGNSALLLSDVRDFAMLPAQRFWRETVCYMSCDHEVINESAR